MYQVCLSLYHLPIGFWKCSDDMVYLRNKSWKPECVGSFNMDWRILVFYPEPEARGTIYLYPPIHVKPQSIFCLP